MNKLFVIIFAVVFSFSHSAFAQVTPNATDGSGNQSGRSSSAPSMMLNPDVDWGKVGDFGTWLVKRFHTINLDALLAAQPGDGTVRNFRAAFSAEGALIYNYELHGKKEEAWSSVGRNAGLQVLPYSLQVLPTGEKKVSVSAVAFRNMNAVVNAKFSSSDYRYGPYEYSDGFFGVIDRLDLVTLSWDDRVSFSNIRSFDLKIVNFNARIGITGNARNYLAFQIGGNAGLSGVNLLNGSNYGYQSAVRMVESMRQNSHFNGRSGLLAQFESEKGARLTLQSNFVGGVGEFRIINQSLVERNKEIDQQNAENSAQYGQDLAAYQNDLLAWENAKTEWEIQNANGNSVSDEYFASQANYPRPSAPVKVDEINRYGTWQHLKRRYGSVVNSAEVSIPFVGKNQNRPKAFGAGIDWTIQIDNRLINTDPKIGKAIGDAASEIDLTGFNNQIVRARLFLNF